MALHYTKKNDNSDDKTVPTAEFIDLMLSSRRHPDAQRKENNIESTK